MTTVNGAQALVRTLVDAGVTTCFTNPGTSEMHFVAALDAVPEMRAVLTLFEGVATGAADGYARMAGAPAATLLHLGPGLGNGLANLHNARKGNVPVVNIVGDHATYHARHDAQLQSDIETVARNVSGWLRTSARTEDLPRDATEAVAAAAGPPGQVATLILPADVSWGEGKRDGNGDRDGATPGTQAEPAQVTPPSGQVPESADLAPLVRALRSGEPAALLLGGSVCEAELAAAAKVAAATGATLLVETFPTRLERGAGLPPVERMAYLAEMASAQLEGLTHLVLAGAKPPASFFAYPDKPSVLAPEGCRLHRLAAPGVRSAPRLEALAEALGAADAAYPVQPAARPRPPTGALTAETVCQAVGAVLPEGAIVSDEAQTSGIFLPGATAGAPRHDVLSLTGGAIGQGLPVAVGAALACPDRPVLALQGDGAALYTVQALWTMAREQLDVTVVLLNNRSYSILTMELARVGAGDPGPRAKAQLDLSGPGLDFTALATGFGVPSSRPDTAEDFTAALAHALATPGPHLIEAVIPEIF
ncbi:acetolactate synthase large subunit [Streptomyces sp. NBC_01187]|uniref:acetolactate synthase large subunit n=1 Tax=Streptomyces sp. NBC_01187 TaxID=2903766 RepID=UPI00386DAF58|nr:acetolactate synthase large subunit [Streptomyces sp. NBC_01187]